LLPAIIIFARVLNQHLLGMDFNYALPAYNRPEQRRINVYRLAVHQPSHKADCHGPLEDTLETFLTPPLTDS
jgi:hypothetical protein